MAELDPGDYVSPEGLTLEYYDAEKGAEMKHTHHSSTMDLGEYGSDGESKFQPADIFATLDEHMNDHCKYSEFCRRECSCFRSK